MDRRTVRRIKKRIRRTTRTALYFIHNNFKLLIAAISIILIAGAFFYGDSIMNGHVSATTSNNKYFTCIEIEEGDTLWSIADTYMTEEYSSVDDYVDEVKSINNLTSDKLYCGASLVVPYYAPCK